MKEINAGRGKAARGMIQDRLPINGRWVAVALLVVLSMSLPRCTYANEGIQDKGFISVKYDRLVKSALDATLIKELDGGFLGIKWGSRPEELKGARHITDITKNLTVYSADLDLSLVLGSVSAYSNPRLVFEKDGGLVQVHVDFDDKEYNTVHDHLSQLLGEPAPIMYELMDIPSNYFIQRIEWRVGEDTRVALTCRVSGATIEISKRDFIVPEGHNLEDTLAVAQLKQAHEYERQNRVLEASSLYQELLNGTGSYHFFTPEAQERLAAYSQLEEAAVYLGGDKDMAFYGLNNIFTSSGGQRWLRINLGPEAMAELQKQRLSVIEAQDRLPNVSAVLCRVKALPAARKYSVVEQMWLDDSNQIIGSRPAWAPQDSGWPVPYIKQVCEDFLYNWFSAGRTDMQVNKGLLNGGISK